MSWFAENWSSIMEIINTVGILLIAKHRKV